MTTTEKMSDPREMLPITNDADRSHPEGHWPGVPTPKDPALRCVAHKRNGDQCRQTAIRGGRVCKKHGGSAPQVIARARVRLQMQTMRMADELLGMALDTTLDYKRPDVRLAAIKEVLDRGGLGVHEQIDLNVDPKPFEDLLGKIAGIANMSRDESRKLREGVIDAEVVDDEAAGSEEGSPEDGTGIAKPWAKE